MKLLINKDFPEEEKLIELLTNKIDNRSPDPDDFR
jgi:hypothetical protein